MTSTSTPPPPGDLARALWETACIPDPVERERVRRELLTLAYAPRASDEFPTERLQ